MSSKTNNPGHLAKTFLTQIYGAFVRDLINYEDKGITEEQCHENEQWLTQMSIHAAELPDGFLWGKTVHGRCDALTEEYIMWNNAENGSHGIQDRKKQIMRIKNKLNKLSSSIRKRTLKLETEADIQPYISMYAATGNLIEAVPDLLVTVSETLANFPNR